MSIGAPSNLGTILIQRLDTILGNTVGQQSVLASGAGPQAVTQPGNPENPSALLNPHHKDPGEAAEQAKSNSQNRAAIDKAAREMQLDNLLGRQTTFRGATQSAPTTLGYAARIILALLNQYPASNRTIYGQKPLLQNNNNPAAQGRIAGNTMANTAGTNTGSNTILGSNQIWAQLATALNQPGALSARFAQALSQSIQSSGLFYEAHLAKLTQGKATPQQLQQEPQSNLGKLMQMPNNQNAQQAQNNQASIQQNITPAETHKSADLPQQHQIQHGNNADQQLQLLVRQQLEVLANQNFIWHGEAWAGVKMECEFQRHQGGGEGGDGDSQTEGEDSENWATRLKLKLPRLGDITAKFNLANDQLILQLTAPESSQTLNTSIEQLRNRLLAQGISTSQITIHTVEPHPDVTDDETIEY